MPEQYNGGLSADAGDAEKDSDWDLQPLPSFRGPPPGMRGAIPPPAFKPPPDHRDTGQTRRVSGSRHSPALRALLVIAAISGAAALASAHVIPPGELPLAAAKVIATVRGAMWRENAGVAASAPSILPKLAAPAPRPPAAPLRTAVRPTISAELAGLALDRGNTLMSLGDIASARPFYRMAADAGLAAAALALARSYDPSYLHRMGAIGVQGDVAKAAKWYRRAAEPNGRSPAVP